ncbi:EAL-associated domain-containing protein [Peribacillus sp. SCS-155]|uniref:EAL domain-containing protein n=1 Tax=Peribacillus sedimenti TaxID=3115297 RepID=UPI00390605DC
MDAMEILTNLDQVQPFYQPIFSADEHRVIGYEILGRFLHESQYISLGPFFKDSTIPEEFRIEVDNYLLEKALSQFADHGETDYMIFINRDPDLLVLNDGDILLDILKKYLGPEDLHRIVLELSDTDSPEIMEQLQHLLAYYRTYGIKIAVDHLGEESHLDRIAQISPNILKVNLEQLRRTGTDSHQVVLFSLGMLARKIGASLLFESIEQNYQLRFAWKNGGRYYQGFYLAKPAAGLIDRNHLRDKLKTEGRSFISYEKNRLEAVYQKTVKMNEGMQMLLQKYKKLDTFEKLLLALGESLSKVCFRLYICDEEGFQRSPNVWQNNGVWEVKHEYMEKNWSWRPYFLENIIRMRYEQRGILSDLYSDIETGETIRTFSYPLENNCYLFIDLSYSYLYESDSLL